MTMSVHEDKVDTRREVKEATIIPITKKPMQRSKQSPADWPEFGEYARRKYPDELDEGLIVLVERLIALQTDRRNPYGTSVM